MMDWHRIIIGIYLSGLIIRICYENWVLKKHLRELTKIIKEIKEKII
jgi:hypothetical protein